MQHFNEQYKIVFENHAIHTKFSCSSVHLVEVRQKSSLLTQRFRSINNPHVLYKNYSTLG